MLEKGHEQARKKKQKSSWDFVVTGITNMEKRKGTKKKEKEERLKKRKYGIPKIIGRMREKDECTTTKTELLWGGRRSGGFIISFFVIS